MTRIPTTEAEELPTPASNLKTGSKGRDPWKEVYVLQQARKAVRINPDPKSLAAAYLRTLNISSVYGPDGGVYLGPLAKEDAWRAARFFREAVSKPGRRRSYIF